MIIGPVFTRELVTAPRRPRMYVARGVYVLTLLVLMCTAWLVVTGTQQIHNVGDLARFGGLLFQWLAPLQLVLMSVLAAFSAAGAVAQEKDRRTMPLLLMTRLSNHELVLGKLLASVLQTVVMLVAGWPVFMLAALLGGVSFGQIANVFLVCLASILLAGSLGATLAQWRERTFQSLALTALAIVIYVGFWEVAAAGVLGESWLGEKASTWAAAFSPVRAVWMAALPQAPSLMVGGVECHAVTAFLVVALTLVALLNGVAIARVRAWNQTPEVRRMRKQPIESEVNIFGEAAAGESEAALALARAGHVDAQLNADRARFGSSREVWNNPVLWREVRTWAYGRKVLFIRFVYLAIFALTLWGLHGSIQSGAALHRGDEVGGAIPAAAKPVAPFLILSLIILTARAATSITSERDGRSLDLLLATDLTPREFIFGKLGGVLWVSAETLIAPLLLAAYLWWHRGLTFENLVYVAGGILVMSLFVAVLGLHCALSYASSRTGIGVSLGTVFFLFLGVATLLVIMITFSGSFQVQLAPFLVFIGGGAIGLFVALGSRNPSTAIGVASAAMPFATFWAITSFLLGYTLPVFLVTAGAYGFAAAAMLIPAFSEFDIATARSGAKED